MSTTEHAAIREKLHSGTLAFSSCEMPGDERVKPVYEKRPEKLGHRRARAQSSEQDQGREPDTAGKPGKTYDVFEDTTELRDDRNRPHTIRRLIMRSLQLAHKHANTRGRHLHKAEKDLQELRGTLNTRPLKRRWQRFSNSARWGL